MLTANLILERLNKEGKLLERREQPSRSFVLQLMDLLYLKHAQADRATRDIYNALRTVDFNPNFGQINLEVASAPGHAGCAKVVTNVDRHLEGQDAGIQVGKGTSAPTPTDYRMADRINHRRSGAAGIPASFANPSFETGDLTGWTSATNGFMRVVVESAGWGYKDGTYYCALESTPDASVSPYGQAGHYAQVSQSIDLTNVTHIRFQLRGQGTWASSFAFEVWVDGRPVYRIELADGTDYPNQLVDVSAFTGIHTITFKCTATAAFYAADHGAWIDNIETLNIVELEYGGCEIVNLTFSDPNGQFTIRRYFTNSSSASITVNEVGIQAMEQDTGSSGRAFLIARDVVSPGIAVGPGEILRVTYVPQITV